MTHSRFWRVSQKVLKFDAELPISKQIIPTRFFHRMTVGDGILQGDFDERTGCGLIDWIGVVTELNVELGQIAVNWRNADITLKPTPQGATYWRKSDWFNFDARVADRYLLDAIFVDIFEELEWRASNKWIPLSVEPSRLITAVFAEHAGSPSASEAIPTSDKSHPPTSEPAMAMGNAPVPLLKGVPSTRPSRNPTSGYVYLIWSQYGYKIGKAVNVQTRTKLFEVKLPFPIRVEHYARFDDYSQAERSLHAFFHAKRLEGEWFDLNHEDVELIKTLGEPQEIAKL